MYENQKYSSKQNNFEQNDQIFPIVAYQTVSMQFIFIDVAFSGGNDYYRELNEQDYDMMLDDTPRGK